MLPKAQLILRKFQPFTPCCWRLFFLYFVLLSSLRRRGHGYCLDCSSPFHLLLEIQALFFPSLGRTQPIRLDHPGRESRFTFFTPSFKPEGRTGDAPWPLSHPSVQHQSEEGGDFPAHGRAVPHPCSSPMFLPSITALLLEIPALNFQASTTLSSTMFR